MTQDKLIQKIWSETHGELKTSMQKEIDVMREILANMHQEEMSIVRHDKLAWDQIMRDRFLMIQRLSIFRTARMEATQKLETLASLDHQGKKVTIEQILPPSNEDSCEILLLLDQILALTVRMNRQNSRNETLFEQSQHSVENPLSLHYADPASKISTEHKRKNSVATYPNPYNY
jgi:flagellar biosynthesis/type III secretory pathway chaperone